MEKEDFKNCDRQFWESVEIANIDTISKAEPFQDEGEEKLIFSETIAIQTNQVAVAPQICSELESKVNDYINNHTK